MQKIVIVAGPTASGKTKEAIRIAKERDGEIISVDSRQVYRGLDIGTEKISIEEMQGIPHHLIDIREANEPYSAGEFVQDAKRLIDDITFRGKLPILAGGTHFYFDALIKGLPEIPMDDELRALLEEKSTEELAREVEQKDPARFARLDPRNRRRLIRALEIIAARGRVPERSAPAARSSAPDSLTTDIPSDSPYDIEWIVFNPSPEELRPRIDERLKQALANGLIDEVRRVREQVGDTRLSELGLEYRIVGEYLRGERSEESIFPALSSRLWHYARRQKAWLRKLQTERIVQ
ncbi:MAG: tRNA (adenosine(37)-N6)-dimethylallyltransferase MiaA [Candidatus Pacebacteria bacterium]|nr:tRNA (adenosine(37)-N6)-dimethylallyltransferase MiaA [Candidatus Paceibacterota bacterium]